MNNVIAKDLTPKPTVGKTVAKLLSMSSWSEHRRRVAELEGDTERAGKKTVQSLQACANEFKVRLAGTDYWIVCETLPAEPTYDEWIYFDQRGIPSMLWDAQRQSLLII